jgi:hypothetical protein
MSKRRKDSEQIRGALPQMAGDTLAGNPERDRIAQRAYELYQARGAGDGRADDDWFTAERELLSGGRRDEQS